MKKDYKIDLTCARKKSRRYKDWWQNAKIAIEANQVCTIDECKDGWIKGENGTCVERRNTMFTLHREKRHDLLYLKMICKERFKKKITQDLILKMCYNKYKI